MALVVDAHLHVWRAIAGDAPGAATIVSPSEDVPIERALDVLGRHGVSRAVLVQPLFRGEDNSYIADCAAADADRIAAVCVIDPRVAGAEDRLEEWVVRRGCRGLRLRPRVPDEAESFGAPPTFALWERARDLKVVVSVLANPEHLPTLGELAERFPEVPIVIDHLAHPRVSQGVEAAGFQTLLGLDRHSNVFIKVSGYYHFSDQPDPYANCWELVRAIHDRYGPERLIWGSDFPHVERTTGYGRSLDLVRRDLPYFSDADRILILGGNASRLYWPADGVT